MKALILFEVKDKQDFNKQKENHQLSDEQWHLIIDDTSQSIKQNLNEIKTNDIYNELTYFIELHRYRSPKKYDKEFNYLHSIIDELRSRL